MRVIAARLSKCTCRAIPQVLENKQMHLLEAENSRVGAKHSEAGELSRNGTPFRRDCGFRVETGIFARRGLAVYVLNSTLHHQHLKS